MERGMIGFGDHHHQSSSSNGNSGLCSMGTMVMVPPLMNNLASGGTDHQILDHKLFLPLNWINNVNSDHDHSGNVNGQRVSANLMPQDHNENQRVHGCNLMESNINSQDDPNCGNMRAKIMAHPLFPRLLTAYVNCQKVGAPPEVVARLEEAAMDVNNGIKSSGTGTSSSNGSNNINKEDEDPALDQFMEAYCEMLAKYEQELAKPFKEAMLIFSKIESQLKSLSVSSSLHSTASDFVGENGSIREDFNVNDNLIDPQAEDRELKVQLLRKYSGYLGSLKQEFMKKKKNGKLPKEARHQLLDWWSRHYKWPYPSESQKVALAESTGLDLKQINNWFINQRKRHWKPSEDMQFVVMDPTNPHYFMENVICNPFPMDCTSTPL